MGLGSSLCCRQRQLGYPAQLLLAAPHRLFQIESLVVRAVLELQLPKKGTPQFRAASLAYQLKPIKGTSQQAYLSDACIDWDTEALRMPTLAIDDVQEPL